MVRARPCGQRGNDESMVNRIFVYSIQSYNETTSARRSNRRLDEIAREVDATE